MQAELLAAIQAGDEQKCGLLLNGLDEKSRRALHPAVATALEELDAALSQFDSSRAQSLQRYAVARLAMLGTATLAELKKTALWIIHAQPAIAILTERRPAWLSEWAEFELERNFRNWGVVRALVREGLIPKPVTEFYILGMIAAPHRHLPPTQFLDQDRGLFDEELWRLFECEGSGELSLAAYDKYVQQQHTWFEAFRAMSEDGTISRARVLASTLDALARDFAPFRASWYSRLHESLKPTRAERLEYRERYLDLLGSRVPATGSFAMKALAELDKSGALDALANFERLAPALEARDKGTAERALAILNKAAKSPGSATVRARIAAVAARALGHTSADVQAAALSLVDLTCTDVEERTVLLHPYRPVLAPSVLAQIESISIPAPKLSATSDAPTAIAKAERVIPINDLGELVEVFAAVLENQGPPVEIERVMDGVARLPASERFTASLAKRAEALLNRRDRAQPRTALADLALAWTRGRQTSPPTAEDNLAHFLLWRIWCVTEQVARKQVRPLLSLPTWPDGRIDPAELVRRIEQQSQKEIKAIAADRDSLFHLDLLQARLRAEPVPEATLPRVELSWKVKSWDASGKTYRHHQPILEVLDSRQRNRFDPALLSTAGCRASLEMMRWCATVCPLWREGWFARGCRELGDNLDWWEAQWSNRAYLEPLLDPHSAIGEMGGLLLALGLGAKEAGEGMLAVDALIGSLREGRLSGAALGRALIAAASSGAIKFARWSKQLARAAQAGPQQAHAIFQAMEALFESGQGKEAGDYSKMVELARELAHQTKLRLSRPGAIANLHAIPTQGKTKRVIAELVGL